MIQDMLEFTCGKPYISISLKDVIKNESSILFEIKKALIYGATKQLYYDEVTSDKCLDNFNNYSRTSKPVVTKLNTKDLQNEQVVKNYFEGFEIL